MSTPQMRRQPGMWCGNMADRHENVWRAYYAVSVAEEPEPIERPGNYKCLEPGCPWEEPYAPPASPKQP